MITINDLKGIPQARRTEAVKCLDELLTWRNTNNQLDPVITGYNWYNTLPKADSLITLSNIHESEAYKQCMLDDLGKLGYDLKTASEYIREKGGTFLHDLSFNIRDIKGRVLPGLAIKNVKTGEYLNINNYKKPLINYKLLRNLDGSLIAEDYGWELNIPFNSKEELLRLVKLFLRKSGDYINNEETYALEETHFEGRTQLPWIDAYKIPVLLLGEAAIRYKAELVSFESTTKVALKLNNNEISFIIHNHFIKLKKLQLYEQLLKIGFKEEQCLGNKSFVEYVDKFHKF